MTSRHAEITVDGVRSPVLELGPEAPEQAVVFVHGNPGSVHDWARLMEAAGDHGRAIALDMPGFGEADRPKDFRYTIEGYSAHLGAALEQLGVQRAHLVLHDFGGPWGLHWATEHPDAYASTTLIDTGVLQDYSWHTLAKIWRMPGVGESVFAITNRSAMKLALRRGQPRPLPEEAFELFYRANKDRGTQRAILRLYRASPPSAIEALGPVLRQLNRPTLVLWGRHDPYIKVEQAERQKLAFPDAEVVVLEESGHWPMWDAPEEVEAAVVPFLARQLGGES
ncbi:MAG: alpha/beta fold hydrolase [Solirubrobacterales bacterium]